MRTIKFRAWFIHDEPPLKFIQETVIDKYTRITMVEDPTYSYSIDKIMCDNNWLLEQFTGLYDKNGMEIYEGDIVLMHQFLFDGTEYDNQLIGSIEYNEGTMSYCLTNLKNEKIQEYMGYTNDFTSFQKELVPINSFYGLHEESFEVIGNIHENKELLDEQ